jgi:two-component system sensor histidine kinase YesM
VKHYVEHLSTELFRYALTVIILLFLLLTVGLAVNLQQSTVSVLDDGASRLSLFWSTSVTEIERGLRRLDGDGKVSVAALRDGTPDERAAAFEVLYAEVNAWAPHSSFAVTDADGVVVASNLYAANRAAVGDPGMIASLRASVERSPVGIARRALWTRLSEPHTGAYVTVRRLTDETGAWDGSLLIGILGEQGLMDQARAQSIERIVVTDAFDNILLDTAVRPSATDDALGGKFTADVRNALTLHANGVDYFYARQTDAGTAVTVTVLAPQRLFWRFATTSLAALGIAAVLMVALARVLTRRRSRRSAQALESLDHAIGEWLGGRLEFRLAEPTFGEFAGIYQSFNQLIGELDAQIKSNADLERSHTALEKRQLEMQFNPHFIFNTMDMVRYQIATDPASASQIVLDLARLMRYSIRGRGTAVRLSEDLEYLTAYLDLHKQRMADRLDYEVVCTLDAAEALVPRLVVQPLVENALAHARPPSGAALRVQVSAEVVDDVLTICVADNGRAIDPALLHAVEESIAGDEPPAAHLGLFLVHRVITLIYGRGEGYGLDLSSDDDTGTRATVRLPHEV